MEKASLAGARSDGRGNRHRRRRAPRRRPRARWIAEAHPMPIVFGTAATGSNVRKRESRCVSWTWTQEPKCWRIPIDVRGCFYLNATADSTTCCRATPSSRCLIDYHVSTAEQRREYRKTEHPGSLHIDH